MAAAVIAGGLVLFPAATSATSASAAISAANLEFATPGTVGFSATLNGLDQVVTATQQIDVSDATGSGAGWNLQATSTAFCTSDGQCLPASATTIAASSDVSVACDADSTCTLATNEVSYPYVLPAGSSAPSPTKFYDAAADTGMGNQKVTATFDLTIPANAYAGTYDSTWTYSLVSAP